MNMYTQVNKKENKSQSAANAVAPKNNHPASTFQFVDNRPEMIVQGKLKEVAQRGVIVGTTENIGTNANVIQAITVQPNDLNAAPITDGKTLLQAFNAEKLLNEKDCPEAFLYGKPIPGLTELCDNVFADNTAKIIPITEAFIRFKRNVVKAQKKLLDQYCNEWEVKIKENTELCDVPFVIKPVDPQEVKGLAKLWEHKLSQNNRPTSKQEDAARGLREIQTKLVGDAYIPLIAYRGAIPCAMAIAMGSFVDWVVANPIEVPGIPIQKGAGRSLLTNVAIHKGVVTFNPLKPEHFAIYNKMGFKQSGGSFATTLDYLLDKPEVLAFIMQNIDPASVTDEFKQKFFGRGESAVAERKGDGDGKQEEKRENLEEEGEQKK